LGGFARILLKFYFKKNQKQNKVLHKTEKSVKIRPIRVIRVPIVSTFSKAEIVDENRGLT
jgi:hypothetical protein